MGNPRKWGWGISSYIRCSRFQCSINYIPKAVLSDTVVKQVWISIPLAASVISWWLATISSLLVIISPHFMLLCANRLVSVYARLVHPFMLSNPYFLCLPLLLFPLIWLSIICVSRGLPLPHRTCQRYPSYWLTTFPMSSLSLGVKFLQMTYVSLLVLLADLQKFSLIASPLPLYVSHQL